MRGRRGAALLDVVMASGLLFTVAYLVLNLFPAASLLFHQARTKGHALEIARSHLEEVKAEPFGRLQTERNRVLPNRTEDGVVFHVRVEVTPLADEKPDELLQARCLVNWQDALGNHDVSYGSYVFAQR